ncbi:MAG: SDR family oxidoreductase [Planctomycetota bacterium]|nr:SDR family oxidoreductase [Planctomycetota bacterium]
MMLVLYTLAKQGVKKMAPSESMLVCGVDVGTSAVRALVCAHGSFGAIGPLVECDPREWMEGVETNLGGAMHLCRAVLPDMLAAREGKIVFLAGPGAAHPRANFSSYSAAQAALRARTQEALASSPIRFRSAVKRMRGTMAKGS